MTDVLIRSRRRHVEMPWHAATSQFHVDKNSSLFSGENLIQYMFLGSFVRKDLALKFMAKPFRKRLFDVRARKAKILWQKNMAGNFNPSGQGCLRKGLTAAVFTENNSEM